MLLAGARVALKVVECVSEEKRREVLAECHVLRAFCTPSEPEDTPNSEETRAEQHPCLPLFFGAFLERPSADRGLSVERVWIAMEVCCAVHCALYSRFVEEYIVLVHYSCVIC